MTQKIIFLDVDGVLNNFVDSWPNQFGKGVQSTFVVDPRCVLAFYHLLAESDAKVVMSSTWAVHKDQMRYLHLVMPGLKEYLHQDWMTPRKFSSTRGQEIQMWLQEHPETTHWVVLEDSRDAWLAANSLNVIETNTVTGLTFEDAIRALKILDTRPAGDKWGVLNEG